MPVTVFPSIYQISEEDINNIIYLCDQVFFLLNLIHSRELFLSLLWLWMLLLVCHREDTIKCDLNFDILGD